MSERISSAEEQALREHLQREAREDWPEYSETLHRRILAAVRHCRTQHVPRRAPALVSWHRMLVAACVAACLLCAVVIGWQISHHDQGTEVFLANSGWQDENDSMKAIFGAVAGQDVNFATLPMPGELAGHGVDTLNRAIISAALTPQSADLAHDTRLAAESMLERLPVGVELWAGP
jgi:hypothetical protein